jgi:hypothetical protein
MILLHTAPNLAEIEIVRELIEDQGIDCALRNDNLQMAIGSVSAVDTWPEIWILNDPDIDRAREIFSDWQTGEQDTPPWTCPECGEEVEGQFTSCWRCSVERPA